MWYSPAQQEGHRWANAKPHTVDVLGSACALGSCGLEKRQPERKSRGDTKAAAASPLSNLVSEAKSGVPQPPHTKVPLRFSCGARRRNTPRGPGWFSLACIKVLLWKQQFLSPHGRLPPCTCTIPACGMLTFTQGLLNRFSVRAWRSTAYASRGSSSRHSASV